MVRIKKIGVLSLAKFQAFLAALLGLVIVILYSFAEPIYNIMLYSGTASYTDEIGYWILKSTPFLYESFGFIALLVLPFIYAAFGFISGLIAAFLYNIIAVLIGGIEIGLE